MSISSLDAQLRQRRLAVAGTSAARDALSAFDTQVHVRHCWPPVMEPPACGKWVLMQPWEFGSLPKAWLPMLARSTRSGLIAGMSAIVTSRPRSRGTRFMSCRWALRRGLSAGARAVGASGRAGVSVAVCWWHDLSQGDRRASGCVCAGIPAGRRRRACHQGDGSKSFYRGQTAEAEMTALRERGYAVKYIDRNLSEAEMAGLYCACDAWCSRFAVKASAADRRGDGLRAARRRHRRGAGARLRHRRDGVPHPRRAPASRRVPGREHRLVALAGRRDGELNRSSLRNRAQSRPKAELLRSTRTATAVQCRRIGRRFP